MHILWTIFGYAGLIIGFGFVVFIHELGHFLAAKYVGIRCEQFAVGFGHAILAYRRGIGARRGTTRMEFERRIREKLGLPLDSDKPLTGPQLDRGCAELGLGETEYRWNWLPLGGYVKMVGQDDMDATATSDDPRSFSQKPVSAAALVISAGVIFNVILAAVMFIGLFLYGFHVPPAQVGGMASNSPAVLAGIKVGDTILEIDGTEPHDFNKLTLASALVHPDRPFEVKVKHADGQIEVLSVTPLKSDAAAGGFLALGVTPTYELRGLDPKKFRLEDIKHADGSPVDPKKMLAPGDVVTAVNGTPVTDVTDVGAYDKALQDSDGQPVRLSVKAMDGTERQLLIEPALLSPFGAGVLSVGGLMPRATVPGVQKDSTASKVFKDNDVIVAMKVEGADVANPSQETIRQRTAAAGDKSEKVSFKVLRDGKLLWTTPIVPATKISKGKYGMGMAIGYDDARLAVSGVISGSAAAKAAVPANSLILKINQKPVGNWLQARHAMLASNGAADVEYAPLNPETDQPEATTTTVRIALSSDELAFLKNLRVAASEEPGFRQHIIVRQTSNPITAFVWGYEETRDLLLQFYVTLHRVAVGSVSPDNFMGPIGIVWSGSLFASRGVDWLVWFLAMISANLAVVNFLPIPIMDGGLFVILMAEKVRGKPITARTQGALQWVGLAIILSIFVFVTYNDLMRFF